MNEKLKPCPFCGGENLSYFGAATHFGLDKIVCRGCGVMVSFMGKRAAKDVAAAWRRRDGDEKTLAEAENHYMIRATILESELKKAGTYACDCCVGCEAMGFDEKGWKDCLDSGGKRWVLDWGRNAPQKAGENNEAD